MIEQELKDIWKNSPQLEKIKFNTSMLLLELKNKLDTVDKSIIARDRRETIASVIGMFIFGYFAYEIPFPLTKVACFLAILYFIYVIYKLRSARKKQSTVDVSLSFKEQLANHKSFINRQKKMITDVMYWYAIPPFIMNVIFILGLGDPTDYNWNPKLLDLLPILPHEKITTILILFLFYALVVWINKRSIKVHYTPIINDITRVEEQLEIID